MTGRGPALAILVLAALLLAAGSAQAAITGQAVKDDFYESNTTWPYPVVGTTSSGDNATGSLLGGVNDSGLNFTFKESLAFRNVSFIFNASTNFSTNWTTANITANVSENATQGVSRVDWYVHNQTINITFDDHVPPGSYFVNITGVKIPDLDGASVVPYDQTIAVCTNASICQPTTLRVFPGPVVNLVVTRPSNGWYNNTLHNGTPLGGGLAGNITFNITTNDRNGNPSFIYFVAINSSNRKGGFGNLAILPGNPTNNDTVGPAGTWKNYNVTAPVANWGAGAAIEQLIGPDVFGFNSFRTTAATASEITTWDGNWTIYFNVSDNSNPPRWNNLTNTSGFGVAIDRTAPTVSGFNASGCGDFTGGFYSFTVADTTGQNYTDNATGTDWVSLVEDNNPTAEACPVQGFSVAPSPGGGSAPYTVTCGRGAAMAEGFHTVTVRVFDKAGNPSNNLSATFEYRNVAGALGAATLTSAASVSSSSYTATGTNDSTAAANTVTLNGATATSTGVGTWSAATTLACGSNTFSAVQTKPNECSLTTPFTVTYTCGGGGYIAPSSGGGGPAPPPAPTPAVETRSILTIPAFEPVTLTFAQTAVEAVTIETKALAAAVSVIVTQHLSRPSGVSEPPGAAAVARYLNVDAKNLFPDDFRKVTLTFTVEREWLNKNNLSGGQVALARHDDATKSWQRLSTRLLKEEGGLLTFEAVAPRLSVFAIIAEPAPAVPLPPPSPSPAAPGESPAPAVATPSPDGATPAPAAPLASPLPPAKSPGFEALAAVAALGVALALARRRRN